VTTSFRGRRGSARTLPALLLGVLLVLFGAAAPAAAHDELIGTDPAADAVVAELPASLTLTFSGVLLDDAGTTVVEVLDASCRSLTAGDPVLDGTRVTQPLAGTATGTVTVVWRVVSSDTHPISGEYAFTVGEGGSAEPCAAAPGDADAGGSPWVVVFAVLGVIAVGVGGALVYLLVARLRARRED